ncbi:MAG: nitroreductase family deazaflavin-dependent oxidoreductase [Acidimicrobiia bacterium]|nr:nitroreductase family deazaflavin-dependent oxidoreductase [Acidimicrobiia bacterium]
MKPLLRAATRVHVWLYKATNGRIGGRIRKARILLLTTTGRKSGRARTTPVSYLNIDNKIAICGASLGSDQPPAWLRNLEQDPHVQVRVGLQQTTALARITPPDQRDNLWPRMTDQLPTLRTYQAKTTRTLPIVLLEPDTQY